MTRRNKASQEQGFISYEHCMVLSLGSTRSTIQQSVRSVGLALSSSSLPDNSVLVRSEVQRGVPQPTAIWAGGATSRVGVLSVVSSPRSCPVEARCIGTSGCGVTAAAFREEFRKILSRFATPP